MENDQLLIPRFKVMANYPNSQFRIGQVISLNKYDACKYWHEYTDKEPFYLEDGDEKKYPSIFRKMEWYQARVISEMPDYLKNYSDEELAFVLKVEKYNTHKDSDELWCFEYYWQNEKDIKRMSLADWVPATKEEFDTFNFNYNK